FLHHEGIVRHAAGNGRKRQGKAGGRRRCLDGQGHGHHRRLQERGRKIHGREIVSAAEINISDLLPRLKDQGYDSERVARRRAWIEEKTGASLKHIGSVSFDTEELRGNIENPIGVAQIPMGVAGPVLVHGRYAKGLFYIPMATSEGALIRSYERGMVALTRSGGVQTALLADENQIVPTFFFRDVAAAADFSDWIPEQFDHLRAAAESTTRHGKLTDVKCYQVGRSVLVNFGYFTGDAQGMNLLVKATDAACQWIQKNYPISSYFVF